MGVIEGIGLWVEYCTLLRNVLLRRGKAREGRVDIVGVVEGRSWLARVWLT